MGKKGGSKPRELTKQELDLLSSQKVQLDQLIDIAQEQFDLSKEDRQRYLDAFVNADTPEAQTAMADLQELITGQRPTGNITTETLFRDVLIGSTGQLKKATEEFVKTQQETYDNFKGELSGLSQEFATSIKNINETYQNDLQTTKESMGTIDEDIYSREKGAAYGGISSAYQEARKQQTADLARRGLAGSGVEAAALSQTYQAEAKDKAQALALSRAAALGLSDARRLQKLGISGTQAQWGAQTAGDLFNTQSGVLSSLYGQQSALNQGAFNLNVANTQQGISNLQALSAAGSGLYVGAQNYLGQASSSYGTGASIAGQTAVGIGRNATDYYYAQQKANASAGAGFGSLAGSFLGGIGGSTAMGGGFGSVLGAFSDIRLKTNIEFQRVENGYNIYKWDWIDGHDYGFNEGVIAQEILESNPEAVMMMDNGYLAVNYNKLGV